jgi:hypothetical protein
VSVWEWVADWDWRSRDSRAQECRRLLTDEATGAVRPCGGSVHTAYIRVGSKGAWTRAGYVCRHCGSYWPDPAPLLEQQGHHLHEATAEEAERYRRAPTPPRDVRLRVRIRE